MRKLFQPLHGDVVDGLRTVISPIEIGQLSSDRSAHPDIVIVPGDVDHLTGHIVILPDAGSSVVRSFSTIRERLRQRHKDARLCGSDDTC